VILTNRVAKFVANPYPLWNNELASQLVANKESAFTTGYTLVNCILKNGATLEETIPLSDRTNKIVVVIPPDNIASFFKDHGLTSLPVNDSFTDALEQVQEALTVFKRSPLAYNFIQHIVRSICILKAESPEIDVSYSHPDIPFSIFVSVCEKQSLLSPIRVAESILHESMHLLLTLIEQIHPIVNQGSTETYYSPWRDEDRPIRGVIHGLFVFRAILEFYKILLNDNLRIEIFEFVQTRISSIRKEIQALSRFPDSDGLTLIGSKLAFNLIREMTKH
jgi:HEXXH motif-containing protein